MVQGFTDLLAPRKLSQESRQGRDSTMLDILAFGSEVSDGRRDFPAQDEHDALHGSIHAVHRPSDLEKMLLDHFSLGQLLDQNLDFGASDGQWPSTWDATGEEGGSHHPSEAYARVTQQSDVDHSLGRGSASKQAPHHVAENCLAQSGTMTLTPLAYANPPVTQIWAPHISAAARDRLVLYLKVSPIRPQSSPQRPVRHGLIVARTLGMSARTFHTSWRQPRSSASRLLTLI